MFKIKSIASKLNLLSIFLIVLTVLATGSYIIWQHQLNAFKNFKQHGEETAVMLAKNIEYGVYTENQQAIGKALQGLSESPDIAYLVVLNKDHKVLAQRNYHFLSQLPEFKAQEVILPEEKVITSDYIEPGNKKSYISIITPVYVLSEAGVDDFNVDFSGTGIQSGNPELIGYLLLGIDQSRIYENSRQFMLQTLLIVPVIIAFGIVLTVWRTRRITQPIKSLVSATHRIANGEFGTELVPTSEDEVAELTHAFNGMSRDLARYQAEDQKQRETLEEQVDQRTSELQQKTNEAYQLADKAEAASKAKSEFLATMSHEIRTPMNGVLGMTELLLNTEMNTRQKRLADTVYRSAESLLGIINNILDFSKIESGKFQLIAHDFDLRALLEETAEMLATQAHSKGLELVVKLPVDLNAIVRGDGERIRQVLVNLMGNAIKFTQHGEVQLKVSWVEQSDSSKPIHLLFEVIDTGPGVSPEQQTLIFESFTQADGSITRRHGGSGLGLSISKQLVALMGSDLKLTSALGQGSCFYFSLALERSPQLALKKVDIKALQGVNMLVVDDNATNREILSEQLNYWGIDCYCAASGVQALSHLQDAKKHNKFYQVALLDWHMPEMDGLALAKALQNEPLLRPMSLVMLSSDSVTFDHDQADQYGINCFLNKPVSQQKLLDCLLELMGSLHLSTQNRPKAALNEVLKLNGRILLAEDNLVNQEVGMGILRAIGCQAEVVNNGLEAVKAVSENHYDLILMDCHMPELDGFQATAKIRELARNSENRLPIIALTADVQKGIIEQCLEAGMDDYVSKPFSQKQLQNALEKWLPAQNQKVKQLPETLASQSADASENMLNSMALDNLRQLTTATGESLLAKAISLFINSAPREIKALRNAFESQDSPALTKIAHNVKSACANLGAQTLAESAASIEAIARKGDFQGIDDLIMVMESTLPDVLAALNREVDTPPITVSAETTVQVQVQNEVEHKRILLVDDDVSFRLITRSALAANEFTVDEADNGLQALEKIKRHKPDLVLLDALMDGLDGFEVCRLMRTEPGMADVPIIMTTGLGDSETINRAFDSGATDFIVKPVNYSILIYRLRFIIRAGQNSAELRNSKLQLAAAHRTARLGYWIWDVKKNHFQLSEQLADICGIDLEKFEATLEGFVRLIELEDRAIVKDMILSAPYSKSIQHIEYRFQADGTHAIVVHQEMVKVIDNGEAMITGTVQDISQRKATEKQMHRLAFFDQLTGLANRTYYQERIQTLIKTAERQKEQFAFLFLDLDGFKDINDSLGHDLGDQLLKTIAQRLQREIRDIDFAARLGGDEFCILLNEVSSDETVIEVAQRCLHKINAPLFLNHQQIKPRVSIGIAVYPRDGKNEVELMKAADTAMYSAKEAGKQRYVFYAQEMAIQAVSRLEKELMLREAFEKEQFVLHYQPQISMLTGRVVGMEALVRWQHPERGLIPPAEFVSFIDQQGLIVDLGNWVLNAVCNQIVQWHEAGLPYLHVAVNISPLHFKEAVLIETVQELLTKNGIPAECLELEVTERAMQTEGHIEVFKKLRQLGIQISIDDFGTGFSCLKSLKQLPLDCLKIDKVFVDDVLANPNTSLLLGTIIGLANALDYKLIAEGVETKEQAMVMLGLGCHVIQGYYFSRPVPSDKIPELINLDFTHRINDEELL